MEKKITFELTIDEIAVIHTILTDDNTMRLFGGLKCDNEFYGDTCWMNLLEKFKCCKHGNTAYFESNGVYYNHELNTLDAYRKKHTGGNKDYWANRVNEVKKLFGVE